MYKTTREEASKILNISTRSVDRYIRSWKLRSKKDWKIVYINDDDIDNFLWLWKHKQEIIINNSLNENTSETNLVSSDENNHNNIMLIFNNLKNDIKQKDEEIKEMSVKIWRMEEIVKNSISMIEFKKSQFLLEESKNSLTIDLDNTKKDLEIKTLKLKEEIKTSYILLWIIIAIFILLIIVWFMKI